MDPPGIEGQSFNLVADSQISALEYLEALEACTGVEYQKIPTPPWKFYLAAALAAVVCYPVSWLVKTPQLSLVAGAVAYVVLFIPFLALLKAMTKDTLGALRSYLGFSPIVSRPLEVAIRYYELVARTLTT
jgi:hypothetical protein